MGNIDSQQDVMVVKSGTRFGTRTGKRKREETICEQTLLQEWDKCFIAHLNVYFERTSECWSDQDLQIAKSRMCPIKDFNSENILESEVSRVPTVFVGAPSYPETWKNKDRNEMVRNILTSAGINPDMKTKSFYNQTVSPANLEARAKSGKPISVVEGMVPDGNWNSSYAEFTKELTDWNGLLQTKQGKDMTGYSVIVSQEEANSTAHFHPLMFFNYSFVGRKTYVFYDAKDENKLRMANRKLSWEQFKADPKARLAFINGESEQNFIVAPAWYSHDVYTCPDQGLYVGMGGFALHQDCDKETAEKILQDASCPKISKNLQIHKKLTKNALTYWNKNKNEIIDQKMDP